MLTLLISRRIDGRFVTRLVDTSDSPLGVDSNFPQAVGTAVREGIRLCKQDRVPVAIDIEGPTGRVHRDQIIRPPVQLRRNKSATARAKRSIDTAPSGTSEK